MGFFDSLLEDNTSSGSTSGSASGSSSGSAGTTAVVEAPKKTNKKTSESDFLIIDDSVTAETIPNTASDLFAPEATAVSPSEESQATTVETVSDIAAEVTFVEPQVEVITPASDEILETVESNKDTTTSDDVIIQEEASPEVISWASETPSISFLDMTEASSEKTQEVSLIASIEEKTAFVSADEANSEAAILQAIEKINSAILAKEMDRDAKLEENKCILDQIAELKKQAKAAQEAATAFDNAANHDRDLVKGLKNLIAA